MSSYKISNTPIPGTLRGEGVFSEELLENKILISLSNDKNKTVTMEQGFVSSAAGTSGFVADVRIAFTGLIGKNIKSLSFYPEEREFLMPPTNILWKKHKEENGKHYFHAVPVRALTEPATTENLRAQAQLELDTTLRLVKHIEELYKKEGWRIRKDPKRNGQIAKLVLKANNLTSNTELPLYRKIESIKETLNAVRNEINEKKNKKNKILLLFSQESRLKRVIDKIDNLDPEFLKKNKMS